MVLERKKIKMNFDKVKSAASFCYDQYLKYRGVASDKWKSVKEWSREHRMLFVGVGILCLPLVAILAVLSGVVAASFCLGLFLAMPIWLFHRAAQFVGVLIKAFKAPFRFLLGWWKDTPKVQVIEGEFINSRGCSNITVNTNECCNAEPNASYSGDVYVGDIMKRYEYCSSDMPFFVQRSVDRTRNLIRQALE